MEEHTRREVEEARTAQEAQAMLGHPTDQEFLGIIRSGMISNCPVTPTAMQNANQIFGPNLAGVTTNYIEIPRAILEQHQRVTLAADIMFINRVPFLSISQGINLITAEHTPSCTTYQLAASIHIMDLYSR